MAESRYFHGVNCAKCHTPLFFAASATGRDTLAPAAPLVIRCTRPDCNHEEDYYGGPHRIFRVEAQ